MTRREQLQEAVITILYGLHGCRSKSRNLQLHKIEIYCKERKKRNGRGGGDEETFAVSYLAVL